jgi:hypothetical protein
MNKPAKIFTKMFRCKRCKEIVTCTSPKRITKAPEEDRCPDPQAPGGYWYCSYEEVEIVVVKPKKKPRTRYPKVYPDF